MRNDTFYASFFRVAISLLLIAGILSSLPVANEIYNIPGNSYRIDGILSFTAVIRNHIYLFLLGYLISLLLFIRGIGRNFTAFIVFIFSYLDQILLQPAIDAGETILRFSLMYFIFADAYQFFSAKRTQGGISAFHTLALMSVKLHLCWVYVSTAWWKWGSEDWITGWATGYVFQHAQVFDMFGVAPLMLKFPWLIQLSTWCILAYQTTFPVFIWFKKLKWIWIVSGILIHLIMAVTLQLYKFELIVILLYGFFITDDEWDKITGSLKLKTNGKR